MEKTGCRIICGAPTTLMVKGLMMMTVDYCIGSRAITNLHFADDIDGLAGEEEEPANLLECFDRASTANGMEFQNTTDALPCHIHLLVCLRIMDPHSRAPKKNTSHGSEVLPQETIYASHTKTMLQTRKSVPRSSRQLDHTKTS